MTYRLLDSGDGRKLESLGDIVVERQASSAFWQPRLPKSEWARAAGVHVRGETGGGHWKWRRPVPGEWTVECGDSKFKIKPTPFGHCGLFPEQAEQWLWLKRTIAAIGVERPKVLNLFAYTGGATLTCARAGAVVTHVDASSGAVDWARDNAALNGLGEASVRWIVDDCARFVARETRRGVRYDALILDPPSFGRGKQGETWKMESDLPGLLAECTRLLGDDPAFVLLSGHTPGISGLVLENLLDERFRRDDRAVQSGEMTILEEPAGRPLPSGTFSRRRRAGPP